MTEVSTAVRGEPKTFSVPDIVERSGFSLGNIEYFFTKGLRFVEIRGRGHQKPVKRVFSDDLVWFLYLQYNLTALEKVGIPLIHLLEQREPPAHSLPKAWSVHDLADFLQVEAKQIEEWADSGLISGDQVQDDLTFATSEVQNFLGVTPRELAASLPSAITQEDLDDLDIDPNHLEYPHHEVEVPASGNGSRPLQFITKRMGEIYIHAGAIVRYSKLFVLDHVLNGNGAVRWFPFLSFEPDLMRAVREHDAYSPEKYAAHFQQGKAISRGVMKMASRSLSRGTIQQHFQILETGIKDEIRRAAESDQVETGKKLFGVLETLNDLKKKINDLPESASILTREITASIKGPDSSGVVENELKGTGWFRRNRYIVRALVDLKGKTYEQRATTEEFQALCAEFARHCSATNPKLFTTTNVVESIGWNRSYRFKIHLAAYVLAAKGVCRILGKGKAVKYQMVATPETVMKVCEEVCA
ncbi:MAG: hypothetical protein ACREJQ_00940 [bacterium]